MEFKGTKGMWTVDKPFKNYDGNVFIDINSEKTKCENCKGSRGGYLIARTYKNAVLKDEQKANAKLIASAPEMFEMLKEANQTIQRLRLLISAHPDCVDGSEFVDYVNFSYKKEKEIEKLLKKITE